MQIRRFQNPDAEQISKLVRRNFLEVNIKDYSEAEMGELVQEYNADKIRSLASYAHIYVVCDGDKIVGTGSISSFWGSETESILLTIFVLPELHGNGLGKKIIAALEQDEFFLRANRIEIPASITACSFYEKMGYHYKNGSKQVNDEGHYKMDKFGYIE